MMLEWEFPKSPLEVRHHLKDFLSVFDCLNETKVFIH